MNEIETGRILTVISKMYPSFKKERDINATAAVWQEIFAGTPYELVNRALMSYLASDTKGFPPVPGAINERIMQMREADEMTENEAWSLVYKAIRRGLYNSREEFDKLPEEIRRIVGHPTQLYEWANLDECEVSTVIAGFVRRAWRTHLETKRKMSVMPALRLNEEQTDFIR